MHVHFGSLSSFVAVAERIRESASSGSEANVVHGPSIDADRGDPLWRGFGAQPQARVETVQYFSNVPAKSIVRSDRRIGKTMDQFDAGLAVFPAQKRNAAALRSQVDRHKRFPLCGQLHRVHSLFDCKTNADWLVAAPRTIAKTLPSNRR